MMISMMNRMTRVVVMPWEKIMKSLKTGKHRENKVVMK